MQDEVARLLGLTLPAVPVDGAPTLPSPLPVGRLAADSVALAARAATALAAARGLPPLDVSVPGEAVTAAFTSERQLQIDGETPSFWSPLSRFFAAADGWVRLHGNYPHHAAAISRALGCEPGSEAVAAATARRSASEVERAIVAASGIAAAVRTPEEWAAEEQDRVMADEPFLSVRRAPAESPSSPPVTGPLPMAGLRVLDLTRVIAGPVAGRVLAAWGADVLRVDPPGLPELPMQHAETSWGKRSAVLDARTGAGRDALHRLAATAHVVLSGYRPGALAGLGLPFADLREANPAVVLVEISAWGWTGPWSGRRGFDSIVQAASGIAAVTGTHGRPGVLPAQALDHATGYLAAAAAMALLSQGGGAEVKLALLQPARWLLAQPRDEVSGGAGADLSGCLAATESVHGTLTYALPPFRLGTEPLRYPHPPTRYGEDAPAWLEQGRG